MRPFLCCVLNAEYICDGKKKWYNVSGEVLTLGFVMWVCGFIGNGVVRAIGKVGKLVCNSISNQVGPSRSENMVI